MFDQIAAPASNGNGRHGHPASALIEGADAISQVTHTPPVSTSLVLAAWRGQEARALELIEATIEDATPADAARARSLGDYARAVLYNGLGRYEAAFVAARRACDDVGLLSSWVLPELVEASARSGNPDVGAAALRRFVEPAWFGSTAWALGLQAQSRALLSDGERADGLYREALQQFASSGSTLQLARAQLLYGEWLRREGRRVDGREHLRAAHATFTLIGAAGFAERAHQELLATGETVRKRTVETRDDLTAREIQIARLAGTGYTNPEIATQLFISARTVEWHLRKVFIKLGVRSRRELRTLSAGRAGIAV